ncbi:UNVERIFIED_CONTAM: VanW family protein [Halobacillus marinus]
MVHKKTAWKLVLVLTIGIFLLFLTTQEAAKAFTFVTGGGNYAENTTVASISLAGKNQKEAEKILADNIEEWRDETAVTLSASGKRIVLDTEEVTFDVKETLEEAVQGSDNGLVVVLSDRFFDPLEEEMDSELRDSLSEKMLRDVVKEDAASLPEDSLEYDAYHFLDQENEELYESIGSQTMNVPAEVDMERMRKLFDHTEMENGETFSMLDLLFEEGVYDEQALNMAATAIYGASLKAGFDVEERHISQRRPAFAEIGMEAGVNLKDKQDLKLYNPYSHDYILNWEETSSGFEVSWTGYPTGSDYQIYVRSAGTVPPKAIVEYSTLLEPGQVEVVQQGKDGESAEIWREDRASLNGDEELLTEDYYPPVPGVEVHSSFVVQNELEEEAQVDSEVVKHPSLDGTKASNPVGPGEVDVWENVQEWEKK